MYSKMKAAVWNGEDRLDIEIVDKPVASFNEVVVKVVSVGVCMTDVHVIKKVITIGEYPTILGHEIAGVIDEIGENVNGWKKGDRVVVDTAVFCGACSYCLSGKGNLCRNGGEIGTSPYNGGYAEYIKVPAYTLHRVPDNVDLDEMGILESFVCPAGAFYRIGIQFGDIVLIHGAGPAGLAYVQTAKACGAGKIIVVARGGKRAELAHKYGADIVLDARSCDVDSEVMKATNGYGAHISVDAAGTEETLNSSVRLAARGGKVLLYGLPSGNGMVNFDIQRVIINQLSLYGVIGNSSAWDPVLQMFSKGVFSMKDMISKTFTFDEINDAIEYVDKRVNDAIKVIVKP